MPSPNSHITTPREIVTCLVTLIDKDLQSTFESFLDNYFIITKKIEVVSPGVLLVELITNDGCEWFEGESLDLIRRLKGILYKKATFVTDPKEIKQTIAQLTATTNVKKKPLSPETPSASTGDPISPRRRGRPRRVLPPTGE